MTGFNLILCYHALGDQEKMKAGFLRLLSIQQIGLEDEEDPNISLEGTGVVGTESLTEGDDALREDIKQRQREAQRYMLNAATLVAPQIEKTPVCN